MAMSICSYYLYVAQYWQIEEDGTGKPAKLRIKDKDQRNGLPKGG